MTGVLSNHQNALLMISFTYVSTGNHTLPYVLDEEYFHQICFAITLTLQPRIGRAELRKCVNIQIAASAFQLRIKDNSISVVLQLCSDEIKGD